MADPAALMLYGNGDTLGNFKDFADDLKTRSVGKTFKKVDIVSALSRDAFFAALEAFGAKQPIGELHIFTHSWGGGLAFGYHTPQTQNERSIKYNETIRRKRKITYDEILAAETGILFTDDLLRVPYSSKRSALQKLFAPFATIQIWGCNSGVDKWIYSDEDASNASVVDDTYMLDPGNEAIGYWWRALNKRNSPKPAAAKALATFFDRPVLGATSGSSVQVLRKGGWISSTAYRQQTGRWPTEKQDLRLQPDKGSYKKFLP